MKLDFTLKTEEERTKYVSSLNLSTLTPRQLSLCADYILYGKDNTGKSEVDKKNIYINTKYNSFKERAPLSLDELMENPNFDEGLLSRGNKHYKIVKPTIDRVDDSDIPTIKEMWDNIDELQHILDVNMGKKEDSKVKKLNETEIYKLRHTLIDIRRGQYYLKDIFKPTRAAQPNRLEYVPMEGEFDIVWNDEKSDYAIAPLGLIGETKQAHDVFYDVQNVLYWPEPDNKKYTIDFRNSNHIYKLLDMYEELCIAADEKKTDNLMGQLVKTLDYYIDRADLKEQHYVIIDMKKRKCSNREITKKLNELFGLTHTENYISTIWTQKICKSIAAAAELHYDEFLVRDDSSCWKRCSCCKKLLLKDSRVFVKRARAADGFNGKCKKCEKTAKVK